jgi:hypothetical protein
MKESLICKGNIKGIIEFKNKNKNIIQFNNAILRTGREALALSLANRIGDNFDFFVNRMLFGDGGVTGTAPKLVTPDRTTLFGTTRASKPVVANIDPNNGSQVMFTSVVTYDEANGFNLNEMALQLHSGDLYSMATFPGINKTSQMQITWVWRLSFI